MWKTYKQWLQYVNEIVPIKLTRLQKITLFFNWLYFKNKKC